MPALVEVSAEGLVFRDALSLRHRLLPKPGGFEGFGSGEVVAHAHAVSADSGHGARASEARRTLFTPTGNHVAAH